jgi:hypothetical protein
MIFEFFPLPTIDRDGVLRDGSLKPANNVCENCTLRECTQNKFRTQDVDDVLTCFQGLNFFVLKGSVADEVTVPGFLLKGRRYPGNYKMLLQTGYELTSEEVRRVTNAYRGLDAPIQNLIAESEKRGASRVLHDLKHLVTALVRVVESSEVERVTIRYTQFSNADVEFMRGTIGAVYNILGAVKNQIEMSDYIIAPDASEFLQKREMDIYKLFEKNVHIYKVLAEYDEKNVEIASKTGYTYGSRVLSNNFVLLPAILLENAIKYSVTGSTIFVDLAERRGKLSVEVNSFGTIVPEPQRPGIWELGNQYIDRNDTSKGGGGYGLFLARAICNATGFEIAYQAEYEETRRGIPMGWNRFVVTEI